MPLHTQHPPGVVFGRLDPLDDAVGRARGHPQRRSGPVDRLMVRGVDGDVTGTERAREPRPRLHLHVVDTPGPRRRGIVGERPWHLAGNVLHERSAKGDVEHLYAATNRQRRQAPLTCLGDEPELPGIAPGMHLTERRMACSAIVGWIDVLSAGEEQPVDLAKEALGGVETGQWGDNERKHAARLERRGIRGIHPDAQNVANDLGGGCDGDDRRGRHGTLREGYRGCGGARRACILVVPPSSPRGPAGAPWGELSPSSVHSVFEKLRASMRDLLDGSASPHERGAALARMKDTLAMARVGLDDLRTGVTQTRSRLTAERVELDTVRRRKALAARISDAETVTVAERFEAQHAERVLVLERKLAVQEEELQLAEREVAAMAAELRAALHRTPTSRSGSASAEADAAAVDAASAAAEELDGMARARSRADRDAEAARKLEALKRRMGK